MSHRDFMSAVCADQHFAWNGEPIVLHATRAAAGVPVEAIVVSEDAFRSWEQGEGQEQALEIKVPVGSAVQRDGWAIVRGIRFEVETVESAVDGMIPLRLRVRSERYTTTPSLGGQFR